MLLSCGYMVIVLNLLSRLGKNLKQEKNINKFGVLYQDTNYQTQENRKRLPQYYIIVFLMRRFLYILIILFIYKYPILQQICNITLHSLTFLYDIIMRPFPLGIIGLLIYFFDFILAIIFGTLPLYMVYINHAEGIGRVHIYILIVAIVLSWIIIICINIRTIYRKFHKRLATVEEIEERIEKERRVEAARIREERRLENERLAEEARRVTMVPRPHKILVRKFYYRHGQKKNKTRSNMNYIAEVSATLE